MKVVEVFLVVVDGYIICGVVVCYLNIIMWGLEYFVFVVFKIFCGVEVCYWIF